MTTTEQLTTEQIKQYWVDVLGYSEQDVKMAGYTKASLLSKMSKSEVEDCITYNWQDLVAQHDWLKKYENRTVNKLVEIVGDYQEEVNK